MSLSWAGLDCPMRLGCPSESRNLQADSVLEPIRPMSVYQAYRLLESGVRAGNNRQSARPANVIAAAR
jgi:hypothetical protein